MSLQLILGPSGAGKSQYMYERIIKESMENPNINYILLVPEQYSMALQRKMVMLHPGGGTMNIDVIGFNRLAYRVFDELNIKPAKVLEDFGKSMLIRQVAGSVSDDLVMYKGCLNKPGFIDEIKALMSELYQYNVSRDRFNTAIGSLDRDEDGTLLLKLKDMATVFRAFDEKIKDEYIVAEQLIEILNMHIVDSKLIKKSVIIMDGFTGFTPIQLKLIDTLLSCAMDVYSIHTMDKDSYEKKHVGQHELFYLSSKTIASLKELAIKKNVLIKDDILIGFDMPKRWGKDRKDLIHLEKNLFRYPYNKYDEIPKNINITAYYNPRIQIEGVAAAIFDLVCKQGYRYKDIAVICGNFDGNISYIERTFPMYGIPFFLDYTRPVKNNPYIDAIGHILRIVEENFSYDSVFSFIKSGVLSDISNDDIELMENYVLARGIKGIHRWKAKWKDEIYAAKEAFLEVVLPFYESISEKKVRIRDYIGALNILMDKLNYEDKLKDTKGLYDKLISVLDKMFEIMAEDEVSVRDFREILDLGLKDLNLGVIPNSLDMVIVGDITRTRLDAVKALFIIDVNDGIIPKKGSSTRIINDKDKDRLEELGITMAPTLKNNAFIEQFYLYVNMTQASHKLFVSYCVMSSDNEGMTPSYLVSRIKGIYTNLQARLIREGDIDVTTANASVGSLIKGMTDLAAGHMENKEKVLNLYKLYLDMGYKELVKKVLDAMEYTNVPRVLGAEVSSLIKLKLMSQSVSKLEQYSKCAYSYFLKYILGINKRDISGVEVYDTGNILHSAMERMFRHVHDNYDNNWDEIDDMERKRLVGEFVKNAWDNEVGERNLDDARYLNLKKTLVRIGVRTVNVLCDISKDDVLKPEYFEYKFTEDIEINNKDKITIKGVVDRGDIYLDEENNSVSLRIIDYKSGHPRFDLSKLYEGLQLQLAVYMNIMSELLETQYSNVKIVPEGMYYYSMRDPYVEVKKEEELEEVRLKTLSLEGVKNKNHEEFEIMLKYADKKARDIAGEILSGNISKEPVVEGVNSACDYCDYASVCRFDSKYGNNQNRYPKFSSNVKERENILRQMKDELSGEGGAVDEN